MLAWYWLTLLNPNINAYVWPLPLVQLELTHRVYFKSWFLWSAQLKTILFFTYKQKQSNQHFKRNSQTLINYNSFMRYKSEKCQQTQVNITCVSFRWCRNAMVAMVLSILWFWQAVLKLKLSCFSTQNTRFSAYFIGSRIELVNPHGIGLISRISVVLLIQITCTTSSL